MKNILKKLALLAIPVLVWLVVFIAFEPNNYFGLKSSAGSSQPVARVRAYQQHPGTHLIVRDVKEEIERAFLDACRLLDKQLRLEEQALDAERQMLRTYYGQQKSRK